MATQFQFSDAEVQFTDMQPGGPAYDAIISCQETGGNLSANIFFYEDSARVGTSQVVTNSGGDVSVSIIYHISQLDRILSLITLRGRKTIICEADSGGPSTAVDGNAQITALTV